MQLRNVLDKIVARRNGGGGIGHQLSKCNGAEATHVAGAAGNSKSSSSCQYTDADEHAIVQTAARVSFNMGLYETMKAFQEMLI